MKDNDFVTKDKLDDKIDMLLIAVHAADKRIDDLRDNMNRNFTIFGIALTMFAILLAGLQIAIVFIPKMP